MIDERERIRIRDELIYNLVGMMTEEEKAEIVYMYYFDDYNSLDNEDLVDEYIFDIDEDYRV